MHFSGVEATALRLVEQNYFHLFEITSAPRKRQLCSFPEANARGLQSSLPLYGDTIYRLLECYDAVYLLHLFLHFYFIRFSYSPRTSRRPLSFLSKTRERKRDTLFVYFFFTEHFS